MLIAHKIALDLNNEQATYNRHLARSISDMGFFELASAVGIQGRDAWRAGPGGGSLLCE